MSAGSVYQLTVISPIKSEQASLLATIARAEPDPTAPTN